MDETDPAKRQRVEEETKVDEGGEMTDTEEAAFEALDFAYYNVFGRIGQMSEAAILYAQAAMLVGKSRAVRWRLDPHGGFSVLDTMTKEQFLGLGWEEFERARDAYEESQAAEENGHEDETKDAEVR